MYFSDKLIYQVLSKHIQDHDIHFVSELSTCRAWDSDVHSDAALQFFKTNWKPALRLMKWADTCKILSGWVSE